MGIMIGTISTGTIYEYKSQSIKTKFVIIGIPLFPIGSFYKITNNLGIPIPLNKKSVWVGYSRTTLLAIGILLSLLSNHLFEYDAFEKTLFTILGVLLTLNGIANWILHWSLKPDEEKVREILHRAVNYNMLPEYLPIDVKVSLLKELLKKYSTQFPSSKWEDDIKYNNINESNKFILFSLAYYYYQIEPTEKNKSLLTSINNHLTL
jgi:hypothetical protein